MRRNIAASIFLISALVLIALSGCSKQIVNQTNSNPGTTIEFKDETYNPNKITIKQNQKVTFVNHSDHDIWPASNIHPTHGIYPQFDPKKPVPPDQSWSFIFDRIGTWRFHDHLSPQITGVINVE